MEIYFVRLAFLLERKLKIPLLPISIGEVTIANVSIPRPLKIGFAKEAHIKIAPYKNPQGNSAVTKPKVADWDIGEYRIILFIILLEIIPFSNLFFLIKIIICITEIMAINIASFLADKSKKFLKTNNPNIPDKIPIDVYDKALLMKYCHVFFWQEATMGEHMPRQCKDPVNP